MIRSDSFELPKGGHIGEQVDKVLIAFQKKNKKAKIINAQCVPLFDRTSVGQYPYSGDVLSKCNYAVLIIYEANSS